MASDKKATFGNLRFDQLSRIAWEEATRVINRIGAEAEPEIRRVAVVGRYRPTPDQRALGERGSPRFRVIGSNLNPGAARSAARRWPGVFIHGTSTDAWTIAGQLGELSKTAQNGTDPVGRTST